jgi:hypothetical protein
MRADGPRSAAMSVRSGSVRGAGTMKSSIAFRFASLQISLASSAVCRCRPGVSRWCRPRDPVPTRRDANKLPDQIAFARARSLSRAGMDGEAKRRRAVSSLISSSYRQGQDLAPLHSGRSLAPFRLSRPRAVAFQSLSAGS